MKTPPTTLLLGTGLALCLAVTASTPWTIQAPGKLAPLREWTLVRDADGQFVSALRNNLTGQLEHFEVFDFDRGDHLSFTQRLAAAPGAAVEAGDTLGAVQSAALERQRVHMEGELASALAELEVYATGEKEPAIQEARLELARRRAQQTWRRQELVRLEALWRRDLVPQAELDQVRTGLEIDEIQLQQATARLAAASTGAKDQELAWRSARVQALRGEANALQERLSGNVVRAPLGGRVMAAASAETLLVVQDTTAYLATLPLPWHERAELDPQGTIEVTAEGLQGVWAGKIVQADPQVHTAGGRSFVFVKALIEGGAPQLGPGLVVRCTAAARPAAAWEYLRGLF